MYLKKVFCFFALLLIFSSLVYAQSLDKTQEDIDKAAGDLEDSVNKFRDLQDPDSWSFIFSQWKEFLLKNKLISGVNDFFTNINIVFVIFFGMDWDLSPQMFFAFLFWIFTLFSAINYFSTINKGGIGILYSFIAVVLLAQINLFEYVGKWSVSLIFYKTSIVWRILFFIVLIGLFVCWMLANKSVANWLKKRREEKEKKELKKSVEDTKDVVTAMGEGAASSRPLGGNPYQS